MVLSSPLSALVFLYGRGFFTLQTSYSRLRIDLHPKSAFSALLRILDPDGLLKTAVGIIGGVGSLDKIFGVIRLKQDLY